ncbi:hypothetical protein GC169_11085 [bacterium]|nr:hypothetical protein [bacterium]
MPLAYPIADDVNSALESEETARTRVEAAHLAGVGVSLVNAWLRPSDAELETLAVGIERGIGMGFIQRYEDDAGRPALAVTFWKPETARTPPRPREPAAAVESETAQSQPKPTAPPPRPVRRRVRQRPVDPRQLDLFMAPDQRGYESKDPGNPRVVIVDEEGDGASFGGVAISPED